MSEKNTESRKPDHIPNTPILHGPLTQSEQQEEERNKYQRERDGKEDNYKSRQLSIEEGQLKANRLIAVFTLILAVLTATGTVVSFLSSQAAKSAADTASNALKLDQIEQRAWISTGITEYVFEEGKPLAVVNQFLNTGRTPAFDVVTCQVIEAIERRGQRIDLGCPDRDKSPGLAVIMPGQNTKRLSNAAGNGGGSTYPFRDGLLRAPLIDELRINKRVVVLYGRIDYRDVFGAPHWDSFCYTMLIIPATSKMPEFHSWPNCETGNDTDK